jgi:hypothetical protein
LFPISPERGKVRSVLTDQPGNAQPAAPIAPSARDVKNISVNGDLAEHLDGDKDGVSAHKTSITDSHRDAAGPNPPPSPHTFPHLPPP